MKRSIVLLLSCMMAASVANGQMLTSTNPDSANAGQSLTVSIFGSGTSFTQGSGVMNVRLVQGSSTINAVTYPVISNTQVDPFFNIPAGTKTGWYDVEVSTDVDGMLIMPQSFYITGPSIVSLVPNNANAGQVLTVSITGDLTNFTQGSQVFSVWLSQGSPTISASSWSVISNTTMTADFTLPINSGGYYDFNVSDDIDGQVVDKLGFYINGPEITGANPDTVDKGSSLAVTVYGSGTIFTQGSGVMSVELRQGPTVIPASPYTVVNDSVINCTFNVDVFKPTGFYDIVVTDDGGTKTKMAGFYVNTPQLTVISPNKSARNQTFTVSITGQSTFFQAGSGTFNVWLNQGPSNINAFPYTVGNNTSIIADFNIGSSASLGFWDVNVSDAADGTVIKVAGFEVVCVTLSFSAVVDPLCFESCDGAATVNVSGGTSPYFYTWDDPGAQTNANATGLCNGTYNVTVADFTGCISTGSVTLVEPSDIIVSAVVTSPLCNGGCDGVIDLTVTGGTGAYIYSWSNSDVFQDLVNICTGSYAVTVTDDNGCTDMSSYGVSDPPALTVTVASVTNTSCNGGCDGAIDLMVTGGTTPYTYVWSNGSNFEDVTNICAGSYIFTVTDANGCADTSSYSVGEGPAITANAGTDASVCANTATVTLGGSVTVATGGNWTTNGSGTIIDATSLVTTYIPSGADITGGTVTFTLTSTGNGPCTAVTDQMILTITPAPTASAGPDQSVCANNSMVSLTGSVTVATGGNWTSSGSGTFVDATALNTTYTPSGADILSGTVIITLTTTGNGNCNAELDNMTVTITPAPVVLAGADQAVCANNVDVVLSGFVQDALGGNWTSSGSGVFDDANLLVATYTPSASDITAGSVTLTLTSTGNGNCNAETDNMVLTINPVPTLSTATNNATCGGSDGDATVTVTSAPTPYTYLWDDSGTQTTATANNLSSGLYMVIVTDANGCIDTAYATVSDAGGPVATATGSDETCGASNGTASVSVVGGTPPLTYLWDDPGAQTNATATGLVANLYSVTVTDSLGCQAVDAVTVNGLGAPSISITNIIDVSCFGGFDGSATGLATGGGAPYTYSWNTSPVQTNATATGLSGGSYTITVLDTNGCTANATANVIDPVILSVSAAGVDPSCAGVDDGTATATGSGGTGAYTYLWDDPLAQTNITATGLAPNNYFVVITDANNCLNLDMVTISPAAAAMTLVFTPFDESNCQSNGMLALDVTGGVVPYTYLWSNGATTQNLNALSVGSYIVTVTDSVGCVASGTGTIDGSQPPVISIAGSDDSGCNAGNGIAILTLSGGTSPFTYNWSNGAITQSISGLVGGTYTLEVTDSMNCVAYDTVIIGQPTSPAVSVIGFDESSCGANDGSAAAIVSGGTPGYTYLWSTGASTQNITNLVPGTYIITVTDANNCTGSDAININAAPGVTIDNITGIDETSCGKSDGAAVPTVTGTATPLTYSWSNGSSSVNATSLSAGTYVLTVTDANGCTAVDSVELSELGSLVLALNITDANCGTADGSALVTVTGGEPPLTYTWSSGDMTALADSLNSGIYIITVVDSNGCSNSAVATISDVGGATVSNITITDVSCNGGSDGAIGIDVSGGVTPYTFSWSNGSSGEDLSGIAAGPYEINVVDGNGCITSESITVAQPDALALTASSVDANCGSSDGEASVSTNGGTIPYTFSWSSGGTDSIETGLTAGVYSVLVTDGNGCMDSISSAVSNIGGPTITVDLIEDADCGTSVGSIYISVSGGSSPYTYSWSNGSTDEDLVGVSAGIYDLTVEDSTACLATASLEITGVPPTFESICMLTVDTLTGMNLIVWEEIQTAGVASYNIYKESTQLDVYYLIGNVPIDSLSEFVDSVSDPAIRSWRYKIAVVDSCGNESNMSDDHKTMHLTINLGINNSINLIWDHYEGYSFGSYYIERYTASTGWVTIDSMASNLTSRTDPNPPQGNLAYRVYSKHPDGCTADKAKNYNSSKSNTTSVNNGGTGTLAATATASNATFGNCDGMATVVATDGVSPYTYLWDDPNAQTSATADSLCPGDFSVLVTDANGDNISTNVTVGEDASPPGYDELSLNDQVDLFPNPNRGQFMLKIDGELDNAEIVIYNLIGEAVYSVSQVTITSQMQIDLSSQPAGVYYLKLVTTSGIALKKVIIE